MQRWAAWIARRLWWGSLWLMRRSWMRRLQLRSMAWMSPSRQARAYQGLIRQNALARRIGLPVIQTLVLVVLVSLTVQAVYSAAVYVVVSGALRPPSLSQEP